MDAATIKELRLKESLPGINELNNRVAGAMDIRANKKHAYQEPNRKSDAIQLPPRDALSAYPYDGNLLIDNNQNENAIRPLALGRKNYHLAARLFAESHHAAQRATMIYSFFAICKKYSLNPFHWLKHTLQNICTMNKHIASLCLQNVNKVPEFINM